MLGQTDAGFTMNTYMHVTDSMQRTVANAMGNLVAEKENEKRIKIIQYTAQNRETGSLDFYIKTACFFFEKRCDQIVVMWIIFMINIL